MCASVADKELGPPLHLGFGSPAPAVLYGTSPINPAHRMSSFVRRMMGDEAPSNIPHEQGALFRQTAHFFAAQSDDFCKTPVSFLGIRFCRKHELNECGDV